MRKENTDHRDIEYGGLRRNFEEEAASRRTNYPAFVGIWRGAEHPDESRFNMARRNYAYDGFDIKMLDEFYSIATENGW